MARFTTTALVFTSYLGFVQIATVAGEIRKPEKNLPRALMGSVLLVMGLYITALFISTSTLSTQKLAELGETAMVDVARSLVGKYGALAILVAGLLATLSSANASILSSSRAVYALGYDEMLPESMSSVSERYGTPHYALLSVGIPIAALTLMGRIEILAEVASLLHLVMYGMICLCLITLRRRSPLWYAPGYRSPGVPYLPAAGAVASFGLIALMQPYSIIFGIAILGIAYLGFALLAEKKEFEKPQPAYLMPELRTPRILIPVSIPDPKPIPVPLLDAFRDLELLVMAYNIVPEQTAPEQSRDEFREKYCAELDQMVAEVREKGVNVKSEIVFTPNVAKSINRFVEVNNCHTVLTAKPILSVNRLLVPIYAADQVDRRLATVLHDLSASSELPVTIVVLTSGEREADDKADTGKLQQMAAAQLRRAGLAENQIRVNSADVSDVAAAVRQLSDDDDLVVLAESSTTDRDSFFNTLHEDIEEAVTCPVLAVLRNQKKEQ
ncbi:MAG: APC family permease [Balneolaceae bacterium]|nr:APC family permease [Balneolaceae bacterium]